MTRATATTRSIAGAHPDLAAFWTDLRASAKPAGVVGYSLGDVQRGQQDQIAALAAGASQAGWGESPHNYSPALAIDVYPIVMDRPGHEGTAAVSNNPADYIVIRQLAEARGLVSGGSWSFPDWPHVELPDWRDHIEGGSPPVGLIALAAVALGLLIMGATA